MALVLIERTILQHALFSVEPVCPHCHSAHVWKWGRFGGRQRYRCKSCAKTFTGLTGTPLARLKYRDKWAGMGWCLWKGLSIRRSAQMLGVHPCTAFRWRHRFLSALRAHEKPRLTGVPELTVTNLIAYRRRLMAWGEQFRGVAARYYHNYLAWFSFMDQACELGPEAALTKLLSRVFTGLSVDQQALWTRIEGESHRLPPIRRQACCGLCAIG
ncbi:MAG: transposase [Bacillota bacterium]|nr:transposase [Bacillota bacterium]